MKVVENGQSIKDQFANCQLGDKRRTRRIECVANNLLANPSQSLPQQNTDWSDLKAAYRLFDRPAVTFEAIATPHWQQTRRTKPGRYLLISDTTDIDQYSHPATTGLGMLGDGKGRGVQLHSCLMYDCKQKQIVGQVGGLLHYRKRRPKNETRRQQLNRYRESSVWGDLVDQMGEPPVGSKWIHVFDRGGDNFESMCHVALSKGDWVIRTSKFTRNVLDRSGNRLTLGAAVEKASPVGSYELNLRARQGVAARTAKIEVSVTQVTFPHPAQRSEWVKNCGIETLTMNVVVIREIESPKGIKPIHWVLLTSLPAGNFDEAWQVIEDYESRWLIEEYHKVIKTGCSVEKHSLRTVERLEPLIGLIAIVGIRLFQMKLIGRNQPQAKAKTHVPSHWLKCLKLARPKAKFTDMSVYTFFRELAKMGGFLGRKHDGEPGWQTIWRGYQKLQSILDAMRLCEQI